MELQQAPPSPPPSSQQAPTPQLSPQQTTPPHSTPPQTPPPFPAVHIFYYAWYGNPATNGKYVHWNHEILDGSKRFLSPPADAGSAHYPTRGFYSSADAATIAAHMAAMAKVRGAVASLSWYPKGRADEQGGYSDDLVEPILDAAAKEGIKVTRGGG